MLTIPETDLVLHPLYLGGNVFGWSADVSPKPIPKKHDAQSTPADEYFLKIAPELFILKASRTYRRTTCIEPEPALNSAR